MKLGFSQKAPKIDIPDWVYNIPPEVIEDSERQRDRNWDRRRPQPSIYDTPPGYSEEKTPKKTPPRGSVKIDYRI